MVLSHGLDEGFGSRIVVEVVRLNVIRNKQKAEGFYRNDAPLRRTWAK